MTPAQQAQLNRIEKAVNLIGPELLKLDKRTWQMRLEEDNIATAVKAAKVTK